MQRKEVFLYILKTLLLLFPKNLYKVALQTCANLAPSLFGFLVVGWDLNKVPLKNLTSPRMRLNMWMRMRALFCYQQSNRGLCQRLICGYQEAKIQKCRECLNCQTAKDSLIGQIREMKHNLFPKAIFPP